MSARSTQQWAVVSLVAARIVYAINWLNIGALFYLMSSDLTTDISGLGALTSSFYLGVGLMQIPGGILAAIWGPKRTVTLGVFVSSLAALGTSISTSLPQAAIFRFIVGSGMALVFSPMVVLASRLLGGRSGVGAGLVNSAFGVGGMLGLFGWILIATATGWRPSLILSGSLGLLSGLMTMILVPRDEKNDGFRFSGTKLKAVIRQRNLAVLGLGALGSNLGSVLISSFMVYYLQTSLGESGSLAGLVAAMVVFLPILTSLWGGRIYDRLKKPRRILVASGFGMVAALVACSIPTLWGASLGAVVGGAAVGPASTVAFAAAKDLSRVEKEYESLTIGWVNCISLTGSVWPPIVFSYLAGSSGYPAAWLAGSGLSFILLIPLIFLVERTFHADDSTHYE
jgi:MFS family permease